MIGGPRRLTTVATMAVLALILVVMAWWGVQAATKPFPGKATAVEPTCSAAEKVKTTYVRRSQVTVSVYNAGARQGFANLTLHRFEAMGFRAGEVANAPTGTTVPRAKVLTTKHNDAAAELVARALGKGTTVEVTDESFGPGIDVFVGKKLRKLDAKAPHRLKLATPVTSCVPVE